MTAAKASETQPVDQPREIGERRVTMWPFMVQPLDVRKNQITLNVDITNDGSGPRFSGSGRVTAVAGKFHEQLSGEDLMICTLRFRAVRWVDEHTVELTIDEYAVGGESVPRAG